MPEAECQKNKGHGHRVQENYPPCCTNNNQWISSGNCGQLQIPGDNSGEFNFHQNTAAIWKEGLQWLYFQWTLNRFSFDKTLPFLCCRSFIESVSTFGITAWHGNVSLKNKNSLFCLVKTASKIIGVRQRPMSDSWNRQIVKKVKTTVASRDHPF